MTDLPYKLSEGVTATRGGIILADEKLKLWEFFYFEPFSQTLHGNKVRISWPDAANILRYREGEPWCATQGAVIICTSGKCHWQDPLHRLAAIVCEDANAFRILYEAIEEFGDE